MARGELESARASSTTPRSLIFRMTIICGHTASELTAVQGIITCMMLVDSCLTSLELYPTTSGVVACCLNRTSNASYSARPVGPKAGAGTGSLVPQDNKRDDAR